MAIDRCFKYFVILYFVFVQISCDNNSEEDDVFIATNEWQTVKEGQKLPKGLHIRMNLKTGLKEAKLIDENGAQPSNSLSTIHASEVNEKSERVKLDRSDLKRKLGNIKDENIKENTDDVKKKYRTYEQLKKDMDELNLIPKSEGEIIKELFEKYQEEIENKEIIESNLVSILGDLEYLAHQYDNALDFIKYDGIRKIILKNLNSTSDSIIEKSLKLFSSLVQNNPKVKVHALEVGSIPILLRVLHLNPSEKIKLRAVTALSCLLRAFPYAQVNFVENGGLAIFSDLFQLDYTKVHVRIVTIMNDFLVERQNDKEHFKSFQQLDLEKMLLKFNWCQDLADLLNILLYSNADDHDALEKSLIAMYSMPDECCKHYNAAPIKKLKEQYSILASSDDDNDYFEKLEKLCDLLLSKIESYNEIKTEL